MPDVDEDELEAELDALGDEIALDDDASYLGRKSVHTYSIVHPYIQTNILTHEICQKYYISVKNY